MLKRYTCLFFLFIVFHQCLWLFFSASEVATFDGQSSISYDLSIIGNGNSMPSNNIKLRFKTKERNGILFYASGSQRDYLSLELIQGRLVMHIDLGKYFHGTVGPVVVVIVWSLDLRLSMPTGFFIWGYMYPLPSFLGVQCTL